MNQKTIFVRASRESRHDERMHDFFDRLQKRLHPHSDLVAIARGVILAFAIQVTGEGLDYLVRVCLARWMGIAQYGIYEYVLAWGLMLAILAELGLPTAMLRLVAQYRVQQQWGLLRGAVRGSWAIALSLGIILAGAVSGGLQLYGDRDWIYTVPLSLGIWMMPLLALVRLQSEIARALGRVALAYLPWRVCWPLSVTIAALVWFRAGHPLTAIPAIGISIAALAALTAIQLILLWRRIRTEADASTPTYAPRLWLRLAFPLLLTNGFLIVLKQTDILCIGAWVSPEAVGIYTAAAKTAMWVAFVLQSVNIVVAPRFAALYAQGNRQGLQQLVATVAHWIFWPSLAIAIALIAFATPVLQLFGSEFATARWELSVLAIGQLVNTSVGSVGYLMMMTGHQDRAAAVFGIAALANLVLNAIAVPLFGTIGAAVATALTLAWWNLWLYRLVVRYLDVYPSVVSTWLRRGRSS